MQLKRARHTKRTLRDSLSTRKGSSPIAASTQTITKSSLTDSSIMTPSNRHSWERWALLALRTTMSSLLSMAGSSYSHLPSQRPRLSPSSATWSSTRLRRTQFWSSTNVVNLWAAWILASGTTILSWSRSLAQSTASASSFSPRYNLGNLAKEMTLPGWTLLSPLSWLRISFSSSEHCLLQLSLMCQGGLKMSKKHNRIVWSKSRLKSTTRPLSKSILRVKTFSLLMTAWRSCTPTAICLHFWLESS